MNKPGSQGAESRGAEEPRSRGAEFDETANQFRWPRLLGSSAPLLLCFLLALAVRCTGATWGLPNEARWYSYHPDESTRQVVGGVVSLLQGDFNPHFFNYPSLSIYATWLVHQLLAGLGFSTGAVSPEYPWPVVRDIIFAGRLFSIFCGALTAPLVFLIARQLKTGRAAVLAGILIALAPGHVQHSHFATVDVPASFFVVLCLFLSLRAQNWKGLALAALVAGLAAGTKYNAGLVLIAPIVSFHFLWKRDVGRSLQSQISGSLALPLVALLSFFVTTPYALLAPREFWGDGLRGGESGFAYELLVHPKIGSGEIFQGSGNGWIYHLTFNLPFVLTWPLVIAALVGIGFACKKREFWPHLIFAGAFFFSLGFSQVRFMRYLLPLAPVLCLMAAYGASRLRFPKVWGAVLAGFALIGCCNVLEPFTQTDPRDLAAAALRDNYLRDSVLRDNYSRGEKIALANNPWFWTPPFQPRGDNISISNSNSKIAVTGFDFEKLKSAQARAFAVSEFEFREAVRLRPAGSESQFLKSLQARSNAVSIFKNKVTFSLPGRDFVPHDYLYTNPETRIYQLGAN